jgi:hypothetical protein
VTRATALAPLLLALSLGVGPSLGCVTSRSYSGGGAPALSEIPPQIRPGVEYGLPYHDAAIVDLALLPAAAGERWRLASADANGWIRFWADGKQVSIWHAHPDGLAGLALARDGTLYSAGFDGRVREWPAGTTEPARAFTIGRPITALAVSDQHIGISDGTHVQLWNRHSETPHLDWHRRARSFVTGLGISADGHWVATAQLRESAMHDAIASHPLAEYREGRSRSGSVSPELAAELRAIATSEFPGAVADFVQVWELGTAHRVDLVPHAPIDGQLGVFPTAVVYREIHGRRGAAMVGRRLEDRAHVSLALVKPWALFHEAQADLTLSVGDFVIGPGGEIVVVDYGPDWEREPPEHGWRVGERRKLAIDRGFAALGDSEGNLAVVELAAPAAPGWLNPGIERPKLLAAAPNSPQLVTATFEPRSQLRLWSLNEASHRAIRVDLPDAVVDEDDGPEFLTPMFPVALALDDGLTTIAVSLSSFSDPHQAAVRVVSPDDGSARVLSVATMPHVIELGLEAHADELLAWSAGYTGFRWTAEHGHGWTAAGGSIPSGAPMIAANGKFSAHVSALERILVDRSTGAPIYAIKKQTVDSEFGAPIPAALANDGTLAVVEPFGGGVVEIHDHAGQARRIELPGAATALAWLDPRPAGDSPADARAEQVLVIGFQDGSIVRVDREAGTTIPVHAGTGGRVWALAPLGGAPGVYIELDDRGLTLHRLDDDAVIELSLGDATTVNRYAESPPQPPSGAGLVAVWRPGTAMPVCAILDASTAGVLMGASILRLGPAEGSAFFAAYTAGEPCPVQSHPVPEPAPVEPVPLQRPRP